MDNIILTRHPDPGKQGVMIDLVKYQTVRDAILSALSAYSGLTFMELGNAVNQLLQGHFDGSISWYYTTVKLDLEARGLIERVPNSRPQCIRLVPEE